MLGMYLFMLSWFDFFAGVLVGFPFSNLLFFSSSNSSAWLVYISFDNKVSSLIKLYMINVRIRI